PILFHLDEQRNTDVPGLPGLEKMLKTYKDTTFIGHGPGWWASISGDVTAEQLGGYPKTKIAPGGAMERLLETYPNIYSDFSVGSLEQVGSGTQGSVRRVNDRDADARRHRQGGRQPDFQRVGGQGAADRLGDLRCLLSCRVGQDETDLLTAIARRQVLLPGRLR